MQIGESDGIPILTYHSIDSSGSIISTAPAVFRQQMTLLSEAGYRVVSLGELIGILNSKKPSTEKLIALTFDDGFQNFYDEALPVLVQYHFKATVFLVTDFCGRTNDWAGNPSDLPRSKILTWNQISELSNWGIEFGAHTRTHPDLTLITASNAADEICESKSIIEEKLGKEISTFAYPYGKFHSHTRNIAEKTFKAACSTNLGKVRRTSDFFSLERIDAYYLSSPLIFNLLAGAGIEHYLQIRQTMRQLKGAFQTLKIPFLN
jgi:peptidoglycan/xylan/chitin deacetylase (PgdA/CDA1 family)